MLVENILYNSPLNHEGNLLLRSFKSISLNHLDLLICLFIHLSYFANMLHSSLGLLITNAKNSFSTFQAQKNHISDHILNFFRQIFLFDPQVKNHLVSLEFL